MKKVFALVLALVLVFAMGTVGMADTKDVQVTYTAADVTIVDVTASTVSNIEYTWTKSGWTSLTQNQTGLKVTATNNSAQPKTIGISGDSTDVAGFANVTINPAEATSIQVGQSAEATFSVAAKTDLTDPSSLSIGSANGNIQFTITIS